MQASVDVFLNAELYPSHFQSSSSYETISLQTDFNNTILATTPMVSKFIESIGSSTVMSSIGFKSVTTTKSQICHPNPGVLKLTAWLLSTDNLEKKVCSLQNFLQPAGELVLRKITTIYDMVSSKEY
jgi:hypothetical protein